MVGAGIALGVLNLPNIALGPALFAEIDAGWPVDISVAYLPPNTAEVPSRKLDLELHPAFAVPFPSGGSRAELSLLQLSAGVCPLRHELSNGRLLGCGGLYGGVLQGTSEGLIRSDDATRFLAGAELYARWHFRLGGPIGLTYSAGVFTPFLREPFGFRDRDGEFQRLFREPVLGGRLDLFFVFIVD